MQLKSFSDGTFTPTHDLLVVGTRNGGSTTANRIVGIDGNTGATLWQTMGNTGGVAKMDIISSSPAVDYRESCGLGDEPQRGCRNAQPSLWKLNPNTGAVLLTASLGDTDTDPTLSVSSDLLFVGEQCRHDLCDRSSHSDDAKRQRPAATAPSFRSQSVIGITCRRIRLIFSGQTTVHALTYNKATKTFSTLWSTAVSGPSAPIGFTGLAKVYVGSADGKIHELDR